MKYPKLEIETTFVDGTTIPTKYTGSDENVSPEFRLKNLSEKAKSLVIVLEDLDHPIKNFTHWTAWNIKAQPIIPENVGKVANIKQGIAYGLHQYAGPKPPKHQKHNYRFTIYALDDTLDLSPNIFKKRLLKIAKPHILQEGDIVGNFKR